MSNRFHAILYFPQTGYDLNKIIGNIKRFMGYEIIARLKIQREDNLLEVLAAAVTEREKKEGQIHKLFESFDARRIQSKVLSTKVQLSITILLVVNGI